MRADCVASQAGDHIGRDGPCASSARARSTISHATRMPRALEGLARLVMERSLEHSLLLLLLSLSLSFFLPSLSLLPLFLVPSLSLSLSLFPSLPSSSMRLLRLIPLILFLIQPSFQLTPPPPSPLFSFPSSLSPSPRPRPRGRPCMRLPRFFQSPRLGLEKFGGKKFLAGKVFKIATHLRSFWIGTRERTLFSSRRRGGSWGGPHWGDPRRKA